jgi:hypothetical protein
VLKSEEYREVIVTVTSRTAEQARFYAEELLTGRIIAEFGETEIVERRTVFTEEGNYIKAEAFVTTIEKIGETVFY